MITVNQSRGEKYKSQKIQQLKLQSNALITLEHSGVDKYNFVMQNFFSSSSNTVSTITSWA